MDNDPVITPLLPYSDDAHGGQFSYAVAEEMRKAFRAAAVRIKELSGQRAVLVYNAKEDFKGRFSEIFQENADTEYRDAQNLSDALEKVATYVDQMYSAAEKEDARREVANDWVRRREARSGVEEFFQTITRTEEPRPNTVQGKPPVFDPMSAPTGERATPGSGGGYGGGTSSARPENLRSFAASSRNLIQEQLFTPDQLTGHLNTFALNCTWGRIDATGVVTAYRRYLNANEKDAWWATVLADSFAQAGGEGNVSTLSDAALANALAAAGVDVSRDGLTIDPPTAAGALPTTGYANDPVNTATGNFIEPETDLEFAGGASGLAFTRMYNSLASGLEETGVFGPGWASVLDQHLRISDDGCRWVLADGRAVDFPREGDGWARAAGESYWLTRETASSAGVAELQSVPEGTAQVLVVRNNTGSWWAYTLAGVWLGTGSGPGRTVSALREDPADAGGTGRVTRLAHARGRFIDVEYVDSRAAVIRSSAGSRVEYGYDDAGRLTEVRTDSGTRTYRWNAQGLIEAVFSAAGYLEAENTYDEQGRVVLQVTQHGRRTRFAYLSGRVTAVSDEDGARSNSWIADAKGRLVGVLDSDDHRQSMAYDGHGNLVSLTERDGSVTVHAYDGRGRRTRTVTPEGADLTYGWDEQDRLTTMVTETGSVITYEYADDLSREPSAVNDPLGGRTELHWQGGLLTRLVGPTGVPVEFEHDEYGDLVATRNAAGDVARLRRDHAGRITAAITPSGAETRFIYDQAGLLVRREHADGAVWSFEHDDAGRLTAAVAPDGGRTELEYAANGELLRTVDPLGRSTERVIDELGNVEALLLPDGARWGFAHDALSRLVAVTDPAGQEWLREYDKIGALTAVVDPTGVRTEAVTDRGAGTATIADAFASATYRFDSYGRPQRVESVDGSAELISYDAAGNPTELVDGEGGLTVLGRDAAGRITSVTSPSGAVTRYEYDHCGRPWRTIDPLGAVTELAYDADQRVIARTLPTGEVETFDYDACGRLVLRVTPGRGNARYGYDKAGRLTFSQDSWYGTRRFKYNLAGELVETINGVGGRTRFDYDLRGRLVRITDPLGGVTEHTYTETNRVASRTDQLGRTTTATYDPAGRQLTQTDPDGHTTTWAYDRSGREVSTSYDGEVLSTISRDLVNRRVVVEDHTAPDGLVTEHEFGFDRRGLLTSRTRGAQALSWSYDADGRRTGFTDAHGVTTTYRLDAAGRVATVSNPRLGEAVYSRDASGRLTAVTAGDLVQQWEYRHGYVAEHVRAYRNSADPEHPATDITLVGRDEDGRVIGLIRSGTVTRYGYDGAGQLVAASTTAENASPAAFVRGSVAEWQYDEGGRLVREFSSTGTRTYSYDAAGQLLAVTDPDGTRTEYAYDGLGRRSRLIQADGSWTEYAWGATGRLKSTAERSPEGMETSRHELWVDALGELAAVDCLQLWWDTASRIPTLAGLGDRQILSLPGGVTGIGDVWTAPGWRAARPTDEADPWAVLGASAIPQPATGGTANTAPHALAGLGAVLPSGISLTANGGLDLAGLEWLGRRAYDPAVRGFLSTDPLAPVLGAGWDGNPYAYAGNDPLNASDPTGLRPMTDEDLKAFDKSRTLGGQLASAWEKYGDYVIAGALIVGGGIMMATGVGGPIGAALVGAGIDAGWQKITTGDVNWGQVATTAVIGIVAGPVAGKVSDAVAVGVGKLAATPVGTAVTSRVSTVVASGVSKLGPQVGGFVSQLPVQTIAKDFVTDTVAGGINNAALYTAEHATDLGSWNWREFGAEIGGGMVEGGVGSPSTHLGRNMSGSGALTVQLMTDGFAGVAGGATENAIKDEEYSFANAVSAGTQNAAISLITERGTGIHSGPHSDLSVKLSEGIDSARAIWDYRRDEE